MDNKEKQFENEQNLNSELEQQSDEHHESPGKRHYYGFGERVIANPESNHSQYNVEPRRGFEPEVSSTQRSLSNQDIEVYTTSTNKIGSVNPIIEHNTLGTGTTASFTVTEKNNKKNKKQKNSKGKGIASYFLMFVASVLLVGGFMFMSDKFNWFTGQNDTVISSNQNNQGGSSDAAVSTVANNYLEDRPDNISELFKASSPAVVKIETYSEVTYSNNNSLFNDPFFRQFFGDNYLPQQQQESNEGRTELQQSGMGTGFFFDEAGYILTNEHVIGDATEIRVIVEGYEEPFIAELLGSSFDLDLAVLKINENIKFPTLQIGNSEQVEVGDWVVAIGNPYGFDHTLTVGVISSKGRPISISDEDGERNYKNLLQTDASINPGNSGGPLINLAGQVVGINTAVSSQAQGIGFAIPTSTITEVLEYLKENKEIPKEPIPFIGVTMSQVENGVRIENIVFDSPAYKAGLNQYDIITQIDDKQFKTPTEVTDYVTSKQVGDTVQLSITRRGETIKVPVVLENRNDFTTP